MRASRDGEDKVRGAGVTHLCTVPLSHPRDRNPFIPSMMSRMMEILLIVPFLSRQSNLVGMFNNHKVPRIGYDELLYPRTTRDISSEKHRDGMARGVKWYSYSLFGSKVGLCLPINTWAILVACRPNILPSHEVLCHALPRASVVYTNQPKSTPSNF